MRERGEWGWAADVYVRAQDNKASCNGRSLPQGEAVRDEK